MTTTATKVNTKWNLEKTQQTTARLISSMYVSAFQTLAKYGEKAHEEFDTVLRQHKIDHYKQMGVKTPLDLVKAIAETDHNVFGSDIEISGDDKKATLKYNSCGMWEAMQKLHKFTPEQEEKMGAQCASSWTHIAKEFGFNYEPKHEKDTYAMTFSKN
jgi:hypothetical protein